MRTRSARRGRVLLAGACAAAMVGSVLAAGAVSAQPPVSAGAPSDPLTRARDAASRWDFRGAAVVEWLDVDGARHTTTVPVVSRRGALVADGPRDVLGEGVRRYVRSGKAWRLLWKAAPDVTAPAVAAKYGVVALHTRSPSVAGHACDWWEFREKAGRQARERVALDRATGLLLAREQLDERGRVVRSVTLARLDVTGPASTQEEKPPTATVVAPRLMRTVPRPYRAPARVGNGFRLLGEYRARDGGLQLAYSDGLQDVSVFERRGSLDWGNLPGGGRSVTMEGRPAREYRTASGALVVWESDGIVFTSVGDPPWSETATVVRDFPRGPQRDALHDLAHFVTAPFSWG